MQKAGLVVATVAAAMACAANGQGVAPAPAPDAAPQPRVDTPEEIAKDAARDRTPTRFYNRPGATRAQYDAAWQDCRLIARGSRTPTGSVPYYYNPAVVSPVVAGLAGGIGGAIGAAIAEGQQRRANRESCLLIRGWRLVRPSAEQAAPALAMTDAARDAFLDRMIGASDVVGDVTERTVFTTPDDPALKVSGAGVEPGSLWLGKTVDPYKPFAMPPGAAAIVFAFRRPTGSAAAGRSARITLVRYDIAKREIVYRPRDWKKTGDTTTYSLDIKGADKTAPYEAQILSITPGDYVIDNSSAGAALPPTGNCFGAPVFHIDAGEFAYLGDFVPFVGVKVASGDRFTGLVPVGPSDAVRATLATRQPQIAPLLKPVVWRDRATYACSAAAMDRQDMTGAQHLPDPGVAEGAS